MIVTSGIKACNSMAAFKKKAIGWKGDRCNCKLCRLLLLFFSFYFYRMSILAIEVVFNQLLFVHVVVTSNENVHYSNCK